MISPKKILIVDDEFPIRYIIEHHLKQEGFEVSLAKDGPSGIRAAQHIRPDVIVLDAMMPGMDGFQVCSQIRSEPDIGHTPIIFLSALGSQKHKSDAFASGADDYLVKPFQGDELVARVTAVLDQGSRIETNTLDAPEGQTVALFSPKGGVGTTTISVQLGEAIAIHGARPVVLIDLDLPLGGVAPMLNLYTERHVVDLLHLPPELITTAAMKQHAQPHCANMSIIPAPGNLLNGDADEQALHLEVVLSSLTQTGHTVILDLGSTLTALAKTAMRLAHVTFLVTSGKPVANKMSNYFMEIADTLGIESRRLMPVINELYGPIDERHIDLQRLPVARIPHASEQSRTRLWLKEQGIRKLVSISV